MYFANQEAKVFKNEYGTMIPFSLGVFFLANEFH
jgi:hypothetical protein